MKTISGSPTHRVLLVPEILSAIFKCCATGALYHATTVCTWWKDLALAQLWIHVDMFTITLAFFPHYEIDGRTVNVAYSAYLLRH